ncbi:MAG: DUF2793 domain-containing protein [Asticcacaulis sp.]
MSDTTPRLTLPLVGDHSQKRLVMNAGLMRLESLVQAQVVSRATTAQPPSPVDGDAYILPLGATGAVWSELAAGTFVRSESSTWETVAFPDGAIVHIADENRFVIKSGSGWVAFEDVLKALDNLTHLGIGTTADSTNVLALKGTAALMSGKYTADGGSGDLSLALNKEADGDTAQLLLQKNFTSRVILGLLGDNNLTVKVSSDGSSFTTALSVDATTGATTLNGLTLKDTALTLQDDGDASKQARFELSGLTAATTRTYGLPNTSATLAHTGSAPQTFAGRFSLANGSAASPTLGFGNGGLFNDTANSGIGLADAAGNPIAYFTTTGGAIVNTTSTASFFVKTNSTSAIGAWRYSSDASGPTNSLRKARGSQASPAVPQLNDVIGNFGFYAYTLTGSASGFTQTVALEGVLVETGTVSASAVGGRLRGRICPIGSAALTEVFRFDNEAGLSMFGANPVIDQNRNVRARLYTVATLPSAATAAGQRAQVSDAVSPTFAAAVSGGRFGPFPRL